MSNAWIAVGVQEVLVVFRFEIKPRSAALGGGVRLYLYGPDQKPGEEIELGGGVLLQGRKKRRSRERMPRLSGKGIIGSTRGPALESNIKRS